jgi:chemotaxis signal transduction protein
VSTTTAFTLPYATTARKSARIALRLHPEWPPVLLPEGVLPQVALDTQLAPVPGCAAWLRGVIGRRGAVVPVFDVAASTGLPPSPLRDMRIVELGQGGEALALLCVEVPVVTPINGPARAEALPDYPERLRPFLSQAYACDGQALAVFDVRGWLSAHAPSVAH